MFTNKHLFGVLLLLALSGVFWAQDGRLTDDRELFMGVTSVNKIKPNLMILMDNSGSMKTVIYHPEFNANTIYSKGSVNDPDEILGDDLSDVRLTSIKSFYINRNKITYNCVYERYAEYNSQYSSTPRKWKIYYDNPDEYDYETPPEIGQTIYYDCNLSDASCSCKTATIQFVEELREGRRRPYKYYYVLTVDANSNPSKGSMLYVNVHKEVVGTDNSVKLSYEPDPSYEESIPITLYGSTDEANSGNEYEENYINWLLFHATEEQINEVSAWASGPNQGKFPDENDVLQEAGLVRIRVARDTIKGLADEVYENCELGLAIFNGSSGANITSPISPSTFNVEDFKGIVGGINATTSTPLAEALADIWRYFKGGGDYMPNTSKHTSGDAATMLAATPIKPYCRSSYVIVITDGQSTQDGFTETKYNNSVFKTTPTAPMKLDVNGVCTEGWGDEDSHDPTSHGDGSYCPGDTCWVKSSSGTDFLDDVAYLMYHNDLFPETNTNFKNMFGEQVISTYVVGLTIDNMLLQATADNGGGLYYKAANANQLKSALASIINNINLRDFAFAAFTAPKRVTTNVGEGASYVGYFMPAASLSNTVPLWQGHLQSFTVTDKWCPDPENDGLDADDCSVSYETEHECTEAHPGINCKQTLSMAANYSWDAAEKLKTSTAVRKLYTHNYSSVTPTTMIAFNSTNKDALRPLFGLPNDTDGNTNANYIIETLNNGTPDDGKILGDIFHSDIAYVGPPPPGKKYLDNLNPSECGTDPDTPKDQDANCFEKFFADHSSRAKVVYVGSNDGIIHQIDAIVGEELWGFIPDEALPSLKKILVDRKYTFTADGRMSADDIYYRGTSNSWKTILAFGLRHGGDAYYALDISNVDGEPHLLWKFKDPDYSGESWGKPIIGKIRYYDATQSKNIDRWVVVAAGGFAFNNEDPGDLRGKAVFVIDASSGDLLWMIGYDSNGAEDDADTVEIDTSAFSGEKWLTQKPEFNYAIPSGLTAVDRDNDGYLDTIYFGNVAGHLFKADISKPIPGNWKTYQLFKHAVTNSAEAVITDVSGGVVTVDNVAAYKKDQSVIGSTSHAMGVISDINGNALTVSSTPTAGGPDFVKDEQLLVRTYDPIFLAPAVAYDNCSNLWVTFGTGDRIRTRTNPTTGKYAAFRDGTAKINSVQAQKIDIVTDDLVPLFWEGNTLPPTNIKVAGKWGWYFIFPDTEKYEKLFDPDPVILPDKNMVPHIYFNTYQVPPSTATAVDECEAPDDSTMRFYDITLDYCGNGTAFGTREEGRFAGGGMFKDYTIIQGTSALASIPPAQDLLNIKLMYTGSLLFWKEKKR